MNMNVKTLCACIALIFLFPLAAHAQYYGQVDPAWELAMDRALLRVHGSIEVLITQKSAEGVLKQRLFRGSSTNIVSEIMLTAKKCDIERNILKNDPLCSGKTPEQEHVETLLLSVSHLFEYVKNPSGSKETHDEFIPRSPAVKLMWSEVADEKLLREFFEKENESGNAEQTSTVAGQPPVSVSLSVSMFIKSSDPNWPMEADMREFSITLIDYDEKKDLALLRVDHGELFPYVASIAPRGMKFNNFHRLWAVGTPVGLGPMATDGSFFHDMKRRGGFELEYFLSSTPIGPGNSGGGLDSCKGETPETFSCELVGVTRAVGNSAYGLIPHTAISVPLRDVHTFLDRNYLGYIIPPPVSPKQ